MSLTPETRTSFTKTIDGILATSDLNTISEKRIRKGIQATTEDDITPYKAEIKELIMERFDIFNARQNGASENGSSDLPKEEPAKPMTNGHAGSPPKRSVENDDADEAAATPPVKKQKKNDTTDADAIYAAKLQAEENLRARPTRGGTTRKAAPAKKKAATKKTKAAKKVKAEDDSDIDSSSDTPKKEVNRTGGFHKPLTLSPALSELLGETSLSRPQTVKKLWEYIREHELQDPADRRQIRCDDLMRAVFKQERVHMFTMTKILNQNLYNPDE